jgi:hypothetical protein
MLGALALAVPAALASKPGGTSGCTQKAPSVTVDNNWAWGSTGSWGLPGQRLSYAIRVTNNDAGCGSSNFVISVSAPNGFAVSVQTNAIALKAPSSGYLWADVTAPSVIGDGNYALVVTVQRSGSSDAASASTTTSYYKVYSSDSTAPTLFWENPWEGATISGRSYNVTVSSSDDHAVKRIDLYLDGNFVSTQACDDVTYICKLNYPWSIRGSKGQHTARFKATDWMGNVGVLTTAFTVS